MKFDGEQLNIFENLDELNSNNDKNKNTKAIRKEIKDIKYLEKIVNQAMSDVEKLGFKLKEKMKDVTFIQLTNAKNTMGVCCSRREYTKDGKIKSVFFLKFSKYLLTLDEKEIKDVVYHEIAHAISNPRNKKHNYYWQYAARTINDAYGLNIQHYVPSEVTQQLEEKGIKKYKHIIKCESCGAIIKRQRDSSFTKHPENYRCGKCGGKFIKI